MSWEIYAAAVQWALLFGSLAWGIAVLVQSMHKCGGIWFWSVGRFGGSFYLRRKRNG
jgi:hypothetical protein